MAGTAIGRQGPICSLLGRGLRTCGVLLILLQASCDWAADAILERALRPAEVRMLSDGRLHVVLVGTGSPLADPRRLPPCTAVVANGHLLLVDAGAGTIRQADLLGLPVSELSGIFVTHFHSDHVGGLGEAITHTWIEGREKRLEIFGPPGIERVVAGFREAYAFDSSYRSELSEADGLDAALVKPRVHIVEVAGLDAVVVFERDDLRVTAFAVDHGSVRPAYGYRFDFRGRAVVVSGDTRPSEALIRYARGADLLIHEAVDKDLGERAARVLERTGQAARADRIRRGLRLHSSPVEAARAAEGASVTTLVLSHLPPIPNALLELLFLRGVGDVFDGRAVVGEDGRRFVLTPPDLERTESEWSGPLLFSHP